jgi:hypothetical protein
MKTPHNNVYEIIAVFRQVTLHIPTVVLHLEKTIFILTFGVSNVK